MRTLRWCAMALLLLVPPALGACGDDTAAGEDVEAGVSCFEQDECGSLTCLCVRDEGEFPGVCSAECEVDGDCAEFGDDYSCSLEFCTGVNVCLRLTN